MKISIIVAVSQNGVIGKDNQLIWRLPDDLKRFKNLTLGHPIIMGRKTFDSIGKALPGRISIVITRNPDFFAENVLVVHNLTDAVEKARQTGTDEVFVIGGGNIYEQALGLSDKLYLTKVYAKIEGDTYFELPDPENWQEIERILHESDEQHPFSFEFIDLTRI